MAGKITDYTPLTTLSDGDLSDWSNFDEVSAYDSRSVSWADLKTNIQNQITFDNIYTQDGTLTGNRIVSMGVNDLTFGSTGDSNLLKFETTNDRIGIGTATPTEKLEVIGNAKISQNLTVNGVGTFEDFATNYYVNINNTNNGGRSGIFLDNLAILSTQGSTMANPSELSITNQGDIMLNAAASGKEIFFETQGTEHLRIINTGNVGIGTATPTEKLHVNGRQFISNQSAPTTPTGGGIVYVEAGALKYIGSSGTITTLGVA